MKMTGPADAVTMEKGMSIIVRETERLSGIVEELLDFSQNAEQGHGADDG